MEYLGIKGTLGNSKVKDRTAIDLISFTEGGNVIYYCPALDLSGYGTNEQEASESFKIVLSEFFNYTLNKGNFLDELKKLGWKISKSKNKPISPPSMQSLLRGNDNFSRIFNTHDFRKFTQRIEMPAFTLQ
jgi:hypothetical protein